RMRKSRSLYTCTISTDHFEAIVWQLYEAGFRPNIKYGAGKLSWVSLTVNNHTSSSRGSR
ncbi:MAG: hypothetical protein ACKPKO_18115, partial [Candidatus Fonsibacter sp.]